MQLTAGSLFCIGFTIYSLVHPIYCISQRGLDCADKYYLRRFLRARQHDLKKAKAMFLGHMEWRREFGTDSILDDFHFHERDAFISMYPQGYHKTDKLVRTFYDSWHSYRAAHRRSHQSILPWTSSASGINAADIPLVIQLFFSYHAAIIRPEPCLCPIFFPCWLCRFAATSQSAGCCLQGRPIYIQHLGAINVKRIYELTTEERTLKFHVQEYERCARYIMPACSRIAGHHIDTTFAIIDMKGACIDLHGRLPCLQLLAAHSIRTASAGYYSLASGMHVSQCCSPAFFTAASCRGFALLSLHASVGPAK